MLEQLSEKYDIAQISGFIRSLDSAVSNLHRNANPRLALEILMLDIPKPNDVVLLVGSYTHLFPFIIGGSKLLSYFKPIDRIDQWEGGAYLYQGGYLL